MKKNEEDINKCLFAIGWLWESSPMYIYNLVVQIVELAKT
jgi:hypothetical protein